MTTVPPDALAGMTASVPVDVTTPAGVRNGAATPAGAFLCPAATRVSRAVDQEPAYLASRLSGDARRHFGEWSSCRVGTCAQDRTGGHGGFRGNVFATVARGAGGPQCNRFHDVRRRSLPRRPGVHCPDRLRGQAAATVRNQCRERYGAGRSRRSATARRHRKSLVVQRSASSGQQFRRRGQL